MLCSWLRESDKLYIQTCTLPQELLCECVQGPPFNASIKDTKALRVTFFWGTLFFVLLTLDVIPGLAELVSLVSVSP